MMVWSLKYYTKENFKKPLKKFLKNPFSKLPEIYLDDMNQKPKTNIVISEKSCNISLCLFVIIIYHYY